MSEKVISEQNIKLKITASDWTDAIFKAGNLLVDSGYITQEYSALCVKNVQELGPYIVIAPGMALAHYRPDPSVLKTGISITTLSSPVEFNCDNDPVDIVLMLAAKSDNEHMDMMERLTNFLSDEEKLEFTRSTTDSMALANDINNY